MSLNATLRQMTKMSQQNNKPRTESIQVDLYQRCTTCSCHM